MKSKTGIFLAIAMLAVMVIPVSAFLPKAIPTIAILSVVKDQSVTIRTANFPANDTFNVYMGLSGTQGIGGILVSKLTSGAGGSVLAKFYIPKELQGQQIIAIRLESTTNPKYHSYNWFYNNTAVVVPVSPSATSTPKSSKIPAGAPYFTIQSVVKGESVTVRLVNYPANRNYAVFMGATKTKTPVYPWYEVAGFNSADGGIFTATFSIPTELQFKPRISIKIYDMSRRIFTYNLFDNVNFP